MPPPWLLAGRHTWKNCEPSSRPYETMCQLAAVVSADGMLCCLDSSWFALVYCLWLC